MVASQAWIDQARASLKPVLTSFPFTLLPPFITSRTTHTAHDDHDGVRHLRPAPRCLSRIKLATMPAPTPAAAALRRCLDASGLPPHTIAHVLRHHERDILSFAEEGFDDRAPDVAHSIALFQVIQDRYGPVQLQTLLKAFVQGRLHGTSNHFAPMCDDHVDARAPLAKLVERGVFTSCGQDRRYTAPGEMQRAYVTGSFFLGDDASWGQVVDMFGSTGACFGVNRVDADEDENQTAFRLLGVDSDWTPSSNTFVWVTYAKGKAYTHIMDRDYPVHGDDEYELHRFGRVVSFSMWESTWPDEDETTPPTQLEVRLLRAIEDPRYRHVVAAPTCSIIRDHP